MKNLWFAFIKVKRISIITFLFFRVLSQNVTRDYFCNNGSGVKTTKFNRFHNRKTFLFHVSLKLVWLKRRIKNISPHSFFSKKVLFYNISGAIHRNNISEILILFEYFRNMYPWHRCFTDKPFISNNNFCCFFISKGYLFMHFRILQDAEFSEIPSFYLVIARISIQTKHSFSKKWLLSFFFFEKQSLYCWSVQSDWPLK